MELSVHALGSSTWFAPLAQSRLSFAAQDELTKWLHVATAHQRPFVRGLRVLHPTTIVGKFALVTRHADVSELLHDSTRFHTHEIYGPRMARTTGRFLLGLDDPAEYQRELRVLRGAVVPGDLERVRALAARHAARLLERAARFGRLDVASELAQPLALAVASEYFGVAGPDATTLTRWLRNIHWDLFLNPTGLPKISLSALTDARALSAYLDTRIAQLRAAQARGALGMDTFIERLLRKAIEAGENDGLVRRNVAGLLVSTVDAISRAIVSCLDQLLRQPRALADARKAAFSGNDERVASYVFEALRFSPQQPLLLRYCPREVCLARGTKRETVLPAGTTVFASVLSAMFDGSVLRAPLAFRVDRPWTHYLHFGDSMHRCFGEGFSRMIIPQAIKALLQCSGLERLRAPEGRIAYDGPFPVRWLVKI